MKWKAELMYIARNDQGVIVGIKELKTSIYESEQENGSQEPSRAFSNVPSKTGIRADASVSSLGLAFPNQRKVVGD